MLSRQRRWQIKQKALGNCVICGKPRVEDSTQYCEAHKQSERARSREKMRIVRAKRTGNY